MESCTNPHRTRTMKEFWRWLHGSGYRGLRSGSDYSRCRSSTENPSTAIHWTSFDLENNMTWSNNRSFKSKPLNNIQQAQFSIGWRFCPVCGHKLYQKNESCSGSISIKCLKCGNIATVDLAYRRRWLFYSNYNFKNRVHCTLNMDCSSPSNGPLPQGNVWNAHQIAGQQLIEWFCF